MGENNFLPKHKLPQITQHIRVNLLLRSFKKDPLSSQSQKLNLRWVDRCNVLRESEGSPWTLSRARKKAPNDS